MQKNIGRFLGCSIIFFLVACNPLSQDKKELQPEGELSQLSFDSGPLLAREKSVIEKFPNSSNLLAFELYRKLASSSENITFSPFSISTALAMTYAGAKEETAASFKKVLYYGDNTLDFHKSLGDFALLLTHKDRSKNDTTIKISNVLWLQKDFSIVENFKTTLANAYKAKPIQLDFAKLPGPSTATINQTIAQQTNGEIPKLLKQDLRQDTRFVLTNALYFKSKWQNAFETGDSSKGAFTLSNGSKKNVLFMRQEDRFMYGEDDQKQFLLMPYQDNDFATLFVLPKEGKLAAVENSLDETRFSAMLAQLSRQKVSLWLPKFSQRSSPNIKKLLIELGLEVAFDDERADFSGMHEKAPNEENIYISDVIHEAIVKMYEDGTTAAAATAVVMAEATAMPPSEPEKVIDFHAERPFLFSIIHQPSNSILFMGRVSDPVE